MRQTSFLLALSLCSTALLADDVDLSFHDVDMEEIAQAVKGVQNGEIARVTDQVTPCRNTEEEGCTRELAAILIGLDGGVSSIVVSKVEGRWLIGTRQKQWLVYGACRAAESEKRRAKEAQGVRLSYEDWRKSLRACPRPTTPEIVQGIAALPAAPVEGSAATAKPPQRGHNRS